MLQIPRNTRLLYLHAYQSYLWNTVASRRLQKYGLKVLPGDIIRMKDHTAAEEGGPDEGGTNVQVLEIIIKIVITIVLLVIENEGSSFI